MWTRAGSNFPGNSEDANRGSCIQALPMAPKPSLCHRSFVQQGRRAPAQKGALHKCDAKPHLRHPQTHSRIENSHASGTPGKEPQLRFVHQQEEGRTAALNAGGSPQYKQGQKKHSTPVTGLDQLPTAEAEGPARCRRPELPGEAPLHERGFGFPGGASVRLRRARGRGAKEGGPAPL